MSDYINRHEAISAIKQMSEEHYPYKTIFRAIRILHHVPPSDVRENVRGEWIADELTGWLCSNCGEHIVLNVKMHGNYCPNCGADMRGEENGYHKI